MSFDGEIGQVVRNVRFLLVVVAASTLSAAGCSGGVEGRPTLVPVKGTVIYKGDPVEGASVTFWGEGAPRPATGTTNAEGKFVLSMYEYDDGAMPGSNKVTVTKSDAGDSTSTVPSTQEGLTNPEAMAKVIEEYQASGGPSALPKSTLPEKYASMQSTPLTQTVSEDPNQNSFVLELTD